MPEQIVQGDQGQADQAVGIASLQTVEQGDAEPLHLEAASAVVGLLGQQIVPDLGFGQLAEVGPERLAHAGAGIIAAIVKRQSGVERDCLAAAEL